ncbi:MAG: hypothetical protein NUV75_01380 [Gallionella sp.]|nr:hypothetical protein [Gallionella sp.]
MATPTLPRSDLRLIAKEKLGGTVGLVILAGVALIVGPKVLDLVNALLAKVATMVEWLTYIGILAIGGAIIAGILFFVISNAKVLYARFAQGIMSWIVKRNPIAFMEAVVEQIQRPQVEEFEKFMSGVTEAKNVLQGVVDENTVQIDEQRGIQIRLYDRVHGVIDNLDRERRKQYTLAGSEVDMRLQSNDRLNRRIAFLGGMEEVLQLYHEMMEMDLLTNDLAIRVLKPEYRAMQDAEAAQARAEKLLLGKAEMRLARKAAQQARDDMNRRMGTVEHSIRMLQKVTSDHKLKVELAEEKSTEFIRKMKEEAQKMVHSARQNVEAVRKGGLEQLTEHLASQKPLAAAVGPNSTWTLEG